jgi:hypothetical protein
MGAHKNDVALLKASYFLESLRILSSRPPVLRQQLGEAENVWQERKSTVENDHLQEMGELRRKIQDNLDRVTPPLSDPSPQDKAWEERRRELENRLKELSDPAD